MSSTPQPQSEKFKKAVTESRGMKGKPENDELLKMYALYKQGIQDPPIEHAAPPRKWGIDLAAKPKKAAWQKVVDQGITPVEAQKKYVELVEQLKSTYGFDPDKAKQAAGNKA